MWGCSCSICFPRRRAPWRASARALAGRRHGSRAGCRCAMFDVVVVGGGPVGACAAALLARGTGRGGGALRGAVLEPAPPATLPPAAPPQTPAVPLPPAR